MVLFFNRKEAASKIIDTIKKEASDFKLFIENKPAQKVVYFIWKAPWMVAANNTFIDFLLKINKFDNVYGHENRYPEIEFSKSNSSHKIDLILLSSEPFPFKESHKNEIQAVFPNSAVKLVDGEMFSWYGSRLIKAFQYFKTLH